MRFSLTRGSRLAVALFAMLALMLAIAPCESAYADCSTVPKATITGSIYPIPPVGTEIDFITTGAVPQVIGTCTIPPNTIFSSLTDAGGNLSAFSPLPPQGLKVSVIINGSEQVLTIQQTANQTLDALEGLSNNPLQIMTLIFGGVSYPLSGTGPTTGQFLKWDGSNIVGAAAGGDVPAIATPSTPGITNHGIAGTATYGYTVVGTNLVGRTAGSVEGRTTTGNATLSVSNYNIVSTSALAGSTSCQIFRTTEPAATALGLIGTVTCGSALNDTGLPFDAPVGAIAGEQFTSPPVNNNTGGTAFGNDVNIGKHLVIGVNSLGSEYGTAYPVLYSEEIVDDTYPSAAAQAGFFGFNWIGIELVPQITPSSIVQFSAGFYYAPYILPSATAYAGDVGSNINPQVFSNVGAISVYAADTDIRQGNVTTLIGFEDVQNIFGASSTVGNWKKFYAAASTGFSKASHNYGFFAEDQSGGPDSWDLYMAGISARNGFEGPVFLGLGASKSGELDFNGSASGVAKIVAPAAAGTPTLTLPTATGTFLTDADNRPTRAGVTSLGTCDAPHDGVVKIAIDALNAASCVVGSTVTNGGGTYCGVVCHNGTGWVHF